MSKEKIKVGDIVKNVIMDNITIVKVEEVSLPSFSGTVIESSNPTFPIGKFHNTWQSGFFTVVNEYEVVKDILELLSIEENKIINKQYE